MSKIDKLLKDLTLTRSYLIHGAGILDYEIDFLMENCYKWDISKLEMAQFIADLKDKKNNRRKKEWQ